MPDPWWRRAFNFVKEAFTRFGADRAAMLGAALAYYAVFALGPMLVIATGIAGIVYGEEASQGLISEQISETVGPEVASLIEQLVSSAGQGGAGVAATVFGGVLLLISASALILQLEAALSAVFDDEHEEKGLKATLFKRLRGIAGVLIIGVMLLIIVGANAVVRFVADRLTGVAREALEWGTPLVSLVLVAGLLALTFRYLPDTRTRWRSVLFGGAVTAILMLIGAVAISFYLGMASGGGAFAAGPIVALLFFIYYMAQIVLFGAELTEVHADGGAPKQELAQAPPAVPVPAVRVVSPPSGGKGVVAGFLAGFIAGRAAGRGGSSD
ncbi:MAG TPA: YihY/virulence factor BrkB family protein [Acidimicrobiia bacterium]|nr:YihY/virulence factor BrkB family protein [Acidimicrobiia bacterium]